MPGVRDYYREYWSPAGYAPTGLALQGTLAGLYRAQVGPSDECLDIGCGDGAKSGRWLSDNAGRYLGVDISEGAIALAREAGLQARVVADAARLELGSESFDVAVCIEVLEHLFDAEGCAREALRVLRPGGVLIVTVPNAAHWRNRIDLALLGRVNPGGDDRSASAPWRDPHIRFFTPATLGRMLRSAGFDVERCEGYSDMQIGARIPHLGRRIERRPMGPISRAALRAAPALFGAGVYAVARRPADPVKSRLTEIPAARE